MIGYKYYHRQLRPFLKNTPRKAYTIMGMTILSLIIFGAFAIRPSLVVITSLNKEVKVAKNAVETIEKKLDDLSQAQVNYQIYKNDITLINVALPNEAAVANLLEILSTAGGRSNVLIRETTVTNQTPTEKGMQTVTFEITVSGDIPRITKFTQELEEGIRQIDISEIELIVNNKPTEPIIAKIKCRAYYLVPIND